MEKHIINKFVADIECPECEAKLVVINTYLTCEYCKNKMEKKIQKHLRQTFCQSCQGDGCWLCGNSGN